MMDISTNRDTTDFTSAWQTFMPAQLAWGTLALALFIIIGYITSIASALQGHLPYWLASLLCAYFTFASFTVVHDAGHGSIVKLGSPLKKLETFLGWAFSVPLLIAPFRLFQKIHDRHHAFTNDPDRDPDHFSFGDKWYLVVLNTLFIPFQYHLMSVTMLKHLKIFRDTYISSIIYLTMVGSMLVVIYAAGYGEELIYFALIPNLIAIFLLAMFFDYIPHHPHQSLQAYQNTRIFPGRLLNVLLLGQNYHLIHHLYPRLPWYQYQPVFHAIEKDLINQGAPIENVFGNNRPRLLSSTQTTMLQGTNQHMQAVLKVAEKTPLCQDSVAIRFNLPDQQILNFKAGQYITVSKWLEGEMHTRSYSIASIPGVPYLEIGVRKTAQGLVSTFMNEVLQSGDELIVRGPFGDFCYPPKQAKEIQELILVAGGSGITPILSILETALKQEHGPSIHLVYATHAIDQLMFFERIHALAIQHPNKLKVDYCLSKPSTELRHQNRLEVSSLHTMFPTLGQDIHLENRLAYLCGPQDLNKLVAGFLRDHGLNKDQIFEEQFSLSETPASGTRHRVSVSMFDGKHHELEVAENQTLLEAANSARISLPHACGIGTCGSCKLKLENGNAQAISDNISGLSIQEKMAGFTLACQCKPLSNLTLRESTY